MAIEEWYLLKAKLAGERPHAKVYQHHLNVFRQVLAYYDAFGTPHAERQIRKQVVDFVAFVEQQLTEPKLEPRIAGLGPFLASNNAFDKEFTERSFIGTSHFKLSDKWSDRINRLSPAVQAKVPQTIDYWLKAYL
ncbi:MAG: hypothetical protein SFV81_00040, partial [Pirellulaceae bacterium]|nr:hypothetical protein [Pirellulaceae bacterium]